MFSGSLVVHVGRICAHPIPASFNFDPNDVLFLVTVTYTKVSSALMYLKGVSIFPGMLCLMKPFSLSQSYILMPVPAFTKKFFFFFTLYKS
jgi:hypothetical protein